MTTTRKRRYGVCGGCGYRVRYVATADLCGPCHRGEKKLPRHGRTSTMGRHPDEAEEIARRVAYCRKLAAKKLPLFDEGVLA